MKEMDFVYYLLLQFSVNYFYRVVGGLSKATGTLLCLQRYTGCTVASQARNPKQRQTQNASFRKRRKNMSKGTVSFY
jgi:hypothetical protein